MGDMELFGDVVEFGEVLGVDHGVTADGVAKVLGEHFADVGKGTLRQDFGLVEFYWQRRSGGRGWWGGHFTVQVHRLRYGRARDRRRTVGEAVMARYGRKYRKVLTFDALKAELDRRKVRLVEVDYGGLPYVKRYWQPESEIDVLVNADADYAGEIGRVLKICSNSRGVWGEAANRDQLKALVGMSEAERERWLGKRDGEELRDVWQCARGRARDSGERRRAEWIGLYAWAMRAGRERGLVTAGEEARTTGGLIAAVADQFPAEFEELAQMLPAVDDVARACLDQVVTPEPLRLADKRMVDVAVRLADWVRDPDLARELEKWADVRSGATRM
jgi:hypothetical protein